MDVEENLLILQPSLGMSGVPKNWTIFKVHYGTECTSSMEKIQQKFLDVLGPLSRLKKELDDIKNSPDDTVSIPVEDHIKLTEKTVLLLAKRQTRFCILDVCKY